MAKYLDPKADLTFKKVFGEHKELVISFLNALLPLDEGKKVEAIEYLPPELVPRTPLSRDTVLNILCEDTSGLKFIVKIQNSWRALFKWSIRLTSGTAFGDASGKT